MSWVRRWTRRLVLWIGPAIISLLLIVLGFLAWVVATQAGSRWVVQTGMHFVDGQASGIQGSIWSGLAIDKLAVALPSVDIDGDQLYLQFNWKELLSRRLHGQTLSAQRLAVQLHETEPSPDDDEPFSIPALPVRIALDRVFLGELSLNLGDDIPEIGVVNVDAAFSLSDQGAQLLFNDLGLSYDGIHAAISADAHLLELAAPWSFDGHVTVEAHTDEKQPLLCVREYLPDLPVESQAEPVDADASIGNAHSALELAQASRWPALRQLEEQFMQWRQRLRGEAPQTLPLSHAETDFHQAPLCTLRLAAAVSGSVDEFALKAKGGGQGLELDVDATVLPDSLFFVQEGRFTLGLADSSSLRGTVNWAADPTADAVQGENALQANLAIQALDLSVLGLSDLPSGLITANVDFDARLHGQTDLRAASLAASFDPESRWNGHELSGDFSAKVQNLAQKPVDVNSWQDIVIDELLVDLALGPERIKLDGQFGRPDSQLNFAIDVKSLDSFWPDLPGATQLAGRIDGSLAKHALQLKGDYRPAKLDATALGEAPINVDLSLAGSWGALTPSGDQTAQEGWQGQLQSFEATHAGFVGQLEAPLAITVAPWALAPEWQWQLGATELELRLPSGLATRIHSRQARGGYGRWQTVGGINNFVLSQALINEIQELIGSNAEKEDRGKIILLDHQQEDLELVHQIRWDLSFDGALSGDASIERVSGDLLVPGDPPFPLGLEQLALNIRARPQGAGVSQITANMQAAAHDMGSLAAQATVLLRSDADGGFSIAPNDTKTVDVQADISDLGWLSLLAGDEMEFGGHLQANVQARSRPDGNWTANGTINGSEIRVLRVDEGIRLLDGELEAYFDNDRLVLERLHFPARLRVKPKEWRTNEWVTSNPDAQDGYLTLSGSWNLATMEGDSQIEFYRYPLMQRTDRYAMVSGKIAVDVPFPHVSVAGELTVDAGWVDLDMLSSVPTLDSDVVVLRPGDEEEPEAESPVDISVNLTVDLGPRFYITGFGLDSGLVGQLTIQMVDGDLRGIGILRTRGGAIEAYGQRLQLRQGSITFQGDLTNPVLHIEALRTGLQVEAGVAVLGTARKPRIDLISYPDVSEAQKLSWLLLGRGPEDSGGGDAMLLLSVGTALLSEGEPFYRKFGIDELSLQTGELGSTGSILPPESVVSGLSAGASSIEQQFVVASKALGRGFVLSIEQALSDTGTVGRASYRLMRGLTAELSVGTVNGLALIYRRFFGR